ncbi:hypothetical protein [Pararhodonellum marinum]|uniref:hypothetical protein n=1 Tax=Pararhodonellum marinum TaxID=2755358 RepID=UPI00188FAA21|nr:hypothetical protein [Pararhodonellum marinum]
MNKIQLVIHHIFRFIWNAIFVISYPILASFGLIFIGITWLFSTLSSLFSRLSSKEPDLSSKESEWTTLPGVELLEVKVFKQILFGPTCYKIRRNDGVPSILEDHFFGNKIQKLDEGLIMEKWNSTDSKELPNFDICLYDPDNDTLSPLTNIKCFDWHLAEKEEKSLHFKWFDGIQGGEVRVAR